MFARFIKHVSFPVYEWWHGSGLLKDMRSFEKSQWFSPEQLREMQWDRLKKLLRHAHQNVPYYKEQFKSLGAAPEDIRTLEDYARFPTLTKKTLQERLQDLVALNIPRSELVKGVTSGSSGQPTFYFHERSSDRMRKAAGRRLTRISGYDIGLKQFMIWRESSVVTESDNMKTNATLEIKSKNSVRKTKQWLHDRFGVENFTDRVDPILMNETEMGKLYNRIEIFRPDIIISYVSTLYMFAKYLDAGNLYGIRPRSIIVSSETLYPYQRELIEKVFRCRVYNRYGLQETGIVAIECSFRQGLHLNQEILHVEYIPTPADNTQLVITDLINFGMPLLRYETGDTGNRLENLCPCGRGLARIGGIEGRIIDLLPSKLGGYVNGQLFATFHWIKGVKQYQVIQEKIDAFRVRIVRTDAFKERELEPMLATIHEKFGMDTSINVEYAETIPFTQGGKYKLVVSEVKEHCV